MKKGVIALIVIGSIFTTTGAVLFGIGLANEVRENKSVTHTYEIKDTISNFDIDVTTSSLEFKLATDGINKIVLEEKEKIYHEVKEENHTLCITSIDNKNWLERMFSFDYGKMSVTFYLTSNTFNNLDISSSTGDILIPHDFSFANSTIALSTGDTTYEALTTNDLSIRASTGDIIVNNSKSNNVTINNHTGKVVLNNYEASGNLSVTTSTGRITLENVKGANITTEASTGHTVLTNVVTPGMMNVKTSTGDIDIVDSDASSVTLSASTGDIDAIFLTGKNIHTDTRTGHVNIPTGVTGGECDIKTSTGDITVSIKG